ncbi:MAG: hypothetical protein WC197_04685 [Candidatus Gastranaerophilaceae bacterium]|jgi:hypothetical protein
MPVNPLVVVFLIPALFCGVHITKIKNHSKEPVKKIQEVRIEPKYEIIKYNDPPGYRELNLFTLDKKNQLNLNAVVSPDFKYMTYTEVYTYSQNNSTLSSVFLIELDQKLSQKDKILKAYVGNKTAKAVIESNFSDVKDWLFNTYTIVDWNEAGDKLLIKEKIGKNFDKVYATKLYVYDVESEKLYNLEEIRNFILAYWQSKKNIRLDDYKWDIQPLGWDADNSDKIIVNAYGYYKNQKKFLGTWNCDYNGRLSSLLSLDKDNIYKISQNGFCLKSTPQQIIIYKENKNFLKKILVKRKQ